MSENQSAITKEELDEFFQKAFGQRGLHAPETTLVEYGRAVITLPTTEIMLRPGGFISGPTQMALADHAAYVAIFTRVGIVPMALTSNLNIDFLRPCTGAALTADARIVKMGSALVVVNVDISGSSSEKISSQSVVTYVLPKS